MTIQKLVCSGTDRELLQEAYIVLRIQTKVVYLVPDLRDTLYTHTKGKAGVFVGIYAAIF